MKGVPLMMLAVSLAMAAAAVGAAEPEALPVTPDFAALVATDGGLWPEVHRVGDELVVLAFNAPGHTNVPGDAGCWASADGGRTWSLRAVAAPRPAPDANWCDASSGLAANGDLLVFSSGYGDAANAHGHRTMLAPSFFRSSDAGHTWRQAGWCPPILARGEVPRPYGPIVQAPDGSLRAAVYGCYIIKLAAIAGYMLRSDDDGLTWKVQSTIAEGMNEGALLPLGNAEWLCAARLNGDQAEATKLYRSLDDGNTWRDEGLVTAAKQHPAHLLRLADQRVLLTYGDREHFEIRAKLSADGGHTWSDPYRIYATKPGDMGYPCTTQLADGSLVTVFYAHDSELHDGYHCGAVGWHAPPG